MHSSIHFMVLGPVETNVYFVVNEDTRGVLVIDPADEPERISARLREKGLTPEAVLLTHGHYDHIGAVEKLREQFGIPVLAGAHEADLLADPALNCSGRFGRRPISLRADRLLEDGESAGMGGFSIQVLWTPGHTEGGVCYYLAEQNLLICGDTLFRGSVGRTDLPTGSMKTLLTSIRDKLLPLPEETTVCPGHGRATSIGFEKERNPFLRDDFYEDYGLFE